jgi:hypothetical protein
VLPPEHSAESGAISVRKDPKDDGIIDGADSGALTSARIIDGVDSGALSAWNGDSADSGDVTVR